MNNGFLLGDATLHIEGGHISFFTGDMVAETREEKHPSKGLCLQCEFAKNEDAKAFEVMGSIPSLGIHDDSLVSGSVEKSHMVWEPESEPQRKPELPFSAWHKNVKVNDRILAWFEIENVQVLGAETTWGKVGPGGNSMLSSSSNHGFPFRTQQRLGHLRIFLKIAHT